LNATHIEDDSGTERRVPGRHAAFFALSAAFHALVIAAIVAIVPVAERPHSEWVLAYLLDIGNPGAAGMRGAGARGDNAAPAPAPHMPAAAEHATAPGPAHHRVASVHHRRPQPRRDAATPSQQLAAAKAMPASTASPASPPSYGGRAGDTAARAAWARGTDSVGAGPGSGQAGVGTGRGGAGDGIASDSVARAYYGQDPVPPYPSRSRRRGEQGTVMLHVLVGADGSVERVEIAASSGFDALDDAALATVRERWRFVPARRDGVPAESWVMVPIRFALTEASANQ
jgi:periplasmic protein TonB